MDVIKDLLIVRRVDGTIRQELLNLVSVLCFESVFHFSRPLGLLDDFM